MNRFFGGGNDETEDKVNDPTFIEAELRDGIEKELKRPDLSPEDRKSYEDALAKLRDQNVQDDGNTG